MKKHIFQSSATLFALLFVSTFLLLPACDSVVTNDDKVENLTALNNPFALNANSDNAAWVDKDAGLCGMAGADADGNLIVGGFGSASILENNNKIMVTCKGNDIVNDSGRAQHFKEFPCIVQSLKTGDFINTTDTHATVARNGNATMNCTYTIE